MGRLDVLAHGDLGIKNGVQKLYRLKKLPDAAAIKRIAKKNKWHPYESVACWYIWRSLETTRYRLDSRWMICNSWKCRHLPNGRQYGGRRSIRRILVHINAATWTKRQFCQCRPGAPRPDT